MCANLLIKTWYPNDKTNEVTQLFLKTRETLPGYIKRVGDSPYVTPTKDGIKVYTIFEFPDEKMCEAVKEISKNEDKFTSVSGYRWTFEVILGAKEALQIAGVKLPTR